jgi:hypothetical protein
MSSIVAELTFGQALLIVIAVSVFAIWVWIVIAVLIDLLRDRDLSGAWKAAWVFFLIFLPVPTVFVYLVLRGGEMRDRAIEHQREMQQAANDSVRTAAASPADELTKLSVLRTEGVISDEEFAMLKVEVLSRPAITQSGRRPVIDA